VYLILLVVVQQQFELVVKVEQYLGRRDSEKMVVERVVDKVADKMVDRVLDRVVEKAVDLGNFDLEVVETDLVVGFRYKKHIESPFFFDKNFVILIRRSK
jgi:hypothetical protein